MDITFTEVRTQIGVEILRRWSHRTILRTMPALLGLFSLIALSTTTLFDTVTLPRTAVWHDKPNLTSSDVIAVVRDRF